MFMKSAPASGSKLPNGTTSYVSIPAVRYLLTSPSAISPTIPLRPHKPLGRHRRPDVLDASPYTAYGVNWVLGIRRLTILAGYLVSTRRLLAFPSRAHSCS